MDNAKPTLEQGAFVMLPQRLLQTRLSNARWLIYNILLVSLTLLFPPLNDLFFNDTLSQTGINPDGRYCLHVLAVRSVVE